MNENEREVLVKDLGQRAHIPLVDGSLNRSILWVNTSFTRRRLLGSDLRLLDSPQVAVELNLPVTGSVFRALSRK